MLRFFHQHRLMRDCLILLLLVFILPTLLLSTSTVQSATDVPSASVTIYVTTLVDEWDTNPSTAPKSKCSLREALQATVSNINGNQGCGNPAISNADEFTLYLLPGTYLLTRNEQLPNNTKKVIIDGRNSVVIDGGGKNGRQEGIFITGGGALELSKLKLQNGWRPFGGALWIKGSSAVTVTEVEFYRNRADFNENGGGGAVAVETGSFQCVKSKFNENSARNAGGAIRAGSVSVLLDRCDFFRNSAQVNGGALAVFGGSAVTHTTVRESKFRENYVTPQTVPTTWPAQYNFNDDVTGGGAIYNKGYLEIHRSEIFKNYSLRSKGGGAIYNQGDLFVYDTAISYNKASPDEKVPIPLGGALLNDGSATILRTSIHHNGSKYGGAILNRTAGRLYLVNSTVADNFAILGGGLENGYNFTHNTQPFTNPGGEMNLWHVTMARNIDSNQEPVNLSAHGNGAIYLANSILDSACLGTIYSHGGNVLKKQCNRISSDNNNDLTQTDKEVSDASKIKMEGLKHNGGPDLAEAGFFSIKVKINKDSPALDTARSAYCTAPALDSYQVIKDQIQADRPIGLFCDAGGLEVGTLEPELETDPEADDTLVFPITVLGEVLASDATLKLKNKGGGNIHWKVEIENDGNGVFHQIDGDTEGDLGKDKDTTLTFRCGPNAPGNYVGSLKITTDLKGSEEITMPMSCAMRDDTDDPYAWDPKNPPGPVNGGSVPLGGKQERVLEITNQGKQPLESLFQLQESAVEAIKFDFFLGGVPIVDLSKLVSIPSDSAATVKITCQPTAPGLYANTLSVQTNDPLHPSLDYNVACEGTEDPSVERLVLNATNLEIPKRSYMGMALSPDGGQLLAGQRETNQIVTYAVNPGSGVLSKQGSFSQSGMNGITGIRYSADGKNVYYSSVVGDGVGVATRAEDGTLSATQVITRGTPIVCGVNLNTNPPTIILCPLGTMDGARSLDISPDDRHLYVTGASDGTLTVFSRQATDGTLTLTQRITRTLEGINLLGGAFGVLVSPDGQNVYVAGRNDNAVVAFKRNTDDGHLHYLTHYVDGDGIEANTAISISQPLELAMSPDGNFLYVTSFGDDALQIFRRTPGDGFIEPIAELAVGVDPYHIEISQDPAGERLLVALWNGDAVKVFARDRLTGLLSPIDGQQDLTMDGPVYMVSSADDRHVYVNLFDGSGVAHLRTVNGNATLFVVSPASLVAGSDGTVIQIQGTPVYPNSQVLVNGAPVATSFVNPYRLLAILPENLLASAGALNLQVRNPAPGGGDSNTVTLAVLAANATPIPSVTDLTPSAINVGGQPLNVVVTGAGFTPQSQALINGGAVQTTYLNPNKLLVELTASDVLEAGPLIISVVNGAGGLVSADVNATGVTATGVTATGVTAGPRSVPVKFQVAEANTPAQPSIVGTFPASLAAGSGEQWLTVHGYNFSQQADAPTIALWNGAERETYVQDGQTLQLLLTAEDLGNVGAAALTIRTTGLPDSEPTTIVIRPADQNPIAHVDTLAIEGAQLIISGSDFVEGAQVRRNGQSLPTTFVNSYVLVATLSIDDLRTGGMIDVVNPGAGADTSNQIVMAPSEILFLPFLQQ
jgi:CSLREA domain-containing protein